MTLHNAPNGAAFRILCDLQALQWISIANPTTNSDSFEKKFCSTFKSDLFVSITVIRLVHF